jgi:hypothetical protein
MIGEQEDAVAHRHLDVALDSNPVGWGRQAEESGGDSASEGHRRILGRPPTSFVSIFLYGFVV